MSIRLPERTGPPVAASSGCSSGFSQNQSARDPPRNQQSWDDWLSRQSDKPLRRGRGEVVARRLRLAAGQDTLDPEPVLQRSRSTARH